MLSFHIPGHARTQPLTTVYVMCYHLKLTTIIKNNFAFTQPLRNIHTHTLHVHTFLCIYTQTYRGREKIVKSARYQLMCRYSSTEKYSKNHLH